MCMSKKGGVHLSSSGAEVVAKQELEELNSALRERNKVHV